MSTNPHNYILKYNGNASKESEDYYRKGVLDLYIADMSVLARCPQTLGHIVYVSVHTSNKLN